MGEGHPVETIHEAIEMSEGDWWVVAYVAVLIGMGLLYLKVVVAEDIRAWLK